MKINQVLNSVLLACLMFSNNSCVFQNEDENFVTIAQEADPRFISSLHYSYLGFNNFYPVPDTFWISSTEELYFKFTNGRIYGVEVALDDRVVLQHTGADFVVKPDGTTIGQHKLTITQQVKSGTGSLADNLDAEYASYRATFVLMVGDFAFKPKFESIQLKDGTVALKWNAYHRGDFQAYEIRKYESYSGYYQGYRKLVVTDPEQTTLIDSTYVGGHVNYVLVVDRGGKFFQSDDNLINFPYKAHMRLGKLGDGKTRLSWDLPPFYKNIRSIEISRSESYVSTPLATNISADQTSLDFVFDRPFGQLNQFVIRMNAKVASYDKPFDRFSVSEDITYGKRIPRFKDVTYNKAEDAYYVVYEREYYYDYDYPSGIYRLDKDLEVTDTVLYDDFFTDYMNLIRSADGKHVYLLHDFLILQLGKNPFLISERYHTGNYLNDYMTEQNFTVSNNNFILYQHDYTVNVLNFETKKLLISTTPATAAHISPDGMHFVNGADMYAFDGTTFQRTRTLPFTDIRFLHFLNSGSSLFIATAYKAYLYDYKNNTIVAEYDVETSQYSYPEFDDERSRYIVRNNGLVMLDLNTRETEVMQVYHAHESSIEGHYLFSNQGFGLKIN